MFLNLIVVILILVLILAIYLWWQASIQPQPFEVMFEVKESELGQETGRILALDGAVNFRDLGGYETTDGRHLAWGKAYRSASLAKLTPEDTHLLTERGIRLVCDLRTYAEVKDHPDRLPEEVEYRHMPVFAKDPIGPIGVLFRRHQLDSLFMRLYRHSIIDQGAKVLGDLLKLFRDPANLPLVIHCTSGKDRTGIASALLLHLCGVPRETIIVDYSLTNLSIEKILAGIKATFIDQRRRPPGLKLEQVYPILSARPEIIEHAFEHIEATYGSIDQYLRGPVGLLEEDIQAIRRNLLE